MGKPPIFIHGILRRSGTNFLNKLLLQHNDVIQSESKIRENWFLHYSKHLVDYHSDLNGLWENPIWGGVGPL